MEAAGRPGDLEVLDAVAVLVDLSRGVRGAATDEPADGEPMDGDQVDDDGSTATSDDHDYQVRLGARLRAVRRGLGMRLQDVEERSGGRFKAVVIGSYERGDRAVAAHRLAALAAFYQVPVADLLPDEWPPAAPLTAPGLRLAVSAIQLAGGGPDVTALRRVVQHVRALRGDHHGQVLTLRGDDLRTVAVALGLDVADLPAWLGERGLLVTR